MVQSPLAEQTSEYMYAPFYWYTNAFALRGLGNGGNPYNQGYMWLLHYWFSVLNMIIYPSALSCEEYREDHTIW